MVYKKQNLLNWGGTADANRMFVALKNAKKIYHHYKHL